MEMQFLQWNTRSGETSYKREGKLCLWGMKNGVQVAGLFGEPVKRGGAFSRQPGGLWVSGVTFLIEQLDFCVVFVSAVSGRLLLLFRFFQLFFEVAGSLAGIFFFILFYTEDGGNEVPVPLKVGKDNYLADGMGQDAGQGQYAEQLFHVIAQITEVNLGKNPNILSG